MSRTFKPLAPLLSLAHSLFQVDLCLTFASGFMLGQTLLGLALLIIAEGLNVSGCKCRFKVVHGVTFRRCTRSAIMVLAWDTFTSHSY